MLGVVAALCALAAATAPQAAGAASWKRCEADVDLLCAKLPVPLDRSGRVPGTVNLHVERLRAKDLPGQAGRGRRRRRRRAAR